MRRCAACFVDLQAAGVLLVVAQVRSHHAEGLAEPVRELVRTRGFFRLPSMAPDK